MKNDYTNAFVINSLGLPFITDIHSLSSLMGISSSMLYLLSQKSENFYNVFEIEKSNGKKREIASPSLPMKLVQRWILENILEKVKVTNYAMAFVKNINGCKKNAEIHHNSLYILHLDLENFFPSINRKRVYGLFKNLGYNNVTSNLLSNISTLADKLPQGGVTSPYLSNLICEKLDRRLAKLCSTRDIIYTRYADDLVFSCDNRDTLKKIKNVIEDIIKDEGFTLNENKTRLLSRYGKVQVNGITLNDKKLKVDKKLKRRLRAKIHHMFATGDFTEYNVVKGYISYISSIEDDYFDKITMYIKKLSQGDFTYYKDIVDTFNQLKIVKSLDDMIYNDFIEEMPGDFYEDYMYYESDIPLNLGERSSFLEAKGYIEKPFKREIASSVSDLADFPF